MLSMRSTFLQLLIIMLDAMQTLILSELYLTSAKLPAHW